MKNVFWIFNIIGSGIWAIGSIVLGYAFGAGYQLANVFTGKFILILIGLALIIIWGYRFVNVRFHIFKKYELFVLFLNIISLWGLASMVRDILMTQSRVADFDVSINIFMLNHVNPAIANIASWISDGGAVLITLLGAFSTLFFLYKKKWRSASIIVLSLASTAVAMNFMKEFFMRARPEDALIVLSDPSFPSAHTAMATAFFFALIYLTVPKIHFWVKRELFIVLCVLIVIAIGFSRVVLNVHWASDVIAGWSLGIFCTTASILFVKYVGGILHKRISE